LEIVCARLRVIAEVTRVRLLKVLDEQGEATVQQLADRLGLVHQNVSRHLVTLFHAGLVQRSREGATVRYSLADWTALWLVDQLASTVADSLDAPHPRLLK
jgi:ArsR family transcriptional regulator